jgi:hypothetical protein
MQRDRNRFGLAGSAILLFTVCLLSFCSCGKKGALTLASYEKPVAPSLLAVHHREDKIILSWEFPHEKEREIAGFIIMKSSGGGFERFGTTTNHVRTFSDSSFKTGASYRYKVLSQNFRGILSDASDLVTLTPSPAPGPPREISAGLSDDFIELTWGDSGKGALYNIYRRFERGAYPPAPLNASPLSANAFRDTFFADRLVYYTIRSLSANLDEGAPSAEVTVDPARFVPPAPMELRCFAAADRIYLYWKEPDAPWIKGFKVYRKFDAGEYTLIGETQIPSFVDADSPSRKRAYRVTSLGPSNEGPAAEILGACATEE